MLGIGFTEMMIILVVALVVLGPSRLPEIAKSLGKGYGEFIRSMRDVREEVERASLTIEEEKKIFKNPGMMVEKIMESTFQGPAEEKEKEEAKPQTPSITPAADSQAEEKTTS